MRVKQAQELALEIQKNGLTNADYEKKQPIIHAAFHKLDESGNRANGILAKMLWDHIMRMHK